MKLPDSITEFLNHELSLSITGAQTVSGGSINHAYRLSTNRGEFFLKWNASAPDDFFEKEAEGLKLLRSAGTNLRIPGVVASGKSEKGRPGFLLMEYIEEGRKGDSFRFGAELAKLHLTTAESFGLNYNNYIGSLHQSNKRHKQWNDFFSEERIQPQLEMAVESGKMSRVVYSQWDRVSSKLDNLLPQSTPSLIHGDLWGGNYLFDRSGTAVLIDPAIYYGHPEMDLAFSRMFGGFSAEFYRGYESVTPVEPGFENRIPLLNLYPLLVHANLFGGHYVNEAESVLKRFE